MEYLSGFSRCIGAFMVALLASAVTAGAQRGANTAAPVPSGEPIVVDTLLASAATDPHLARDPDVLKLATLLHAQLTAADPLATYVDVECEMDRLFKQYGTDADRLVTQAEQLAIDPVRDREALIRIDDAVSRHTLTGCAEDRVAYGKGKP
jgi:hypothetical protein